MTPHVSRGTGELPLTARLLPSATRLYPALDPHRWYPAHIEDFGLWLDLGRPYFVFALHFEVRP